MAVNKITVIGAGSVGSTTAFALALKNIANEIVIIDINEDKALGEAMDIHQGTPLFSEPVNVYAGDYKSAVGSDIVVITSGVARKPGQTRIDLAQTNVNIIKQITPQIVRSCPDATYVIVANPVDILTYVFSKVSGIPQNRIIGSGTLLDTARLRARIAEYLSVSQKNVHAYVFGEHGETSFVPWSIAEVSTISLADYKELIKLDQGIMVDLDYDEIDQLYALLRRQDHPPQGLHQLRHRRVRVRHLRMPAGRRERGRHRFHDAERRIRHFRRVPVPADAAGNGKVQGRITPRLTDEELEKLRHSADALKAVIAQIDLTMPETKA